MYFTHNIRGEHDPLVVMDLHQMTGYYERCATGPVFAWFKGHDPAWEGEENSSSESNVSITRRITFLAYRAQ